jgi:hypothetical protein
MKAGALDRRISILRQGPAVDDGYTTLPGEFGLLANRSASWRPASRTEQFENAGIEAKSGGSFWIRSDITTRQVVETDKLVYTGRIYEILGIREIGRREGLELIVVAGDDDSPIDISGLSPIPGAVPVNLEFMQISRVAESNVSGHRVVAASADGRVSHVGKLDADAVNVLGVTEGSALAGNPVSIVTIGEMQETSWSWTAGPVWLGDDGIMTQVVPIAGLLVQVGVATDPTKLNINPQVIVQL